MCKSRGSLKAMQIKMLEKKKIFIFFHKPKKTIIEKTEASNKIMINTSF